MLRRLLVLLAILAGLAVLADRAVATFAGQAVARSVQRTEGLSERPDVTFHGFPFLTQAVRGRFERVTVGVRGLRREQLRIDRIDAEMADVRVGLGDALAGRVAAVPVGRASARVHLSYADVNEFLRTRAGDPQVAPGDAGRIEVRADVGMPGQGPVRVVGQGRLAHSGSTLVVRVTDLARADGGRVPAAVRAEGLRRLSVSVPLGELPFGIRIIGVTVTPEGMSIEATAGGLVIVRR